MTQLMDLKVDFAFKQIFGKKGNEAILTAFLNAVLKPSAEQRIKTVEILNPEIFRAHREDKAAMLDIFAQTEAGVKINIEIQLANNYDMVERTLYYWAEIYTDELRKGKAYIELPKTITVNILNFRLLQETERFHTCFHLYEDEEKFMLTDLIEIRFAEIPKLMVKWGQQAVNPREDALVCWLLLLKADEHEEIRRELEGIAMEDPVLKKAFEVWEELSQDRYKWAEYISRKKAIMDESSLKRSVELANRAAELSKEELQKAEAELEMVREEVERARKQAEQSRKQAEQSREQAEQSREQAEQARKQAEQAREQAEQAKEQAEQAKEQAEQAKEQAEQAKEQAEQAREEGMVIAAKKMLAEGVDIQVVSKALGLPLAELEKWRQ